MSADIPRSTSSVLVISYVPLFLDRKSTRLNSSHLGISYAVFCLDKKSTRLNSSHLGISYAVFCLKKKKTTPIITQTLKCDTLDVLMAHRKYEQSVLSCVSVSARW